MRTRPLTFAGTPAGFPIPFMSRRFTRFWRRLSVTDRLAAVVVAASALLWILNRAGLGVPTGILGFTTVSAVIAGFFLLFRLVAVYRHQFLWRLRNRLIAAYIFIAVVPMILLITIGVLTSRILYQQFSAYVITHEVESRVEKLAEIAEILLTSVPAPRSDAGEDAPASTVIETYSSDLPGMRIEFSGGDELLKTRGTRNGTRFAGLVQSGDQVELRAVALQRPGGRRVSLSVRVNQEFLTTLAPELGPLKVTIMRPAREGEPNAIPLGKDRNDKDRFVVAIEQIETLPPENRPPPTRWVDYEVDGVAELEVVYVHPDGVAPQDLALFASVYTRPSVLNERLFLKLGQLGGLWVTFLLLVIVVFFILELAALITGVILTRTITRAVADLYAATEYVQRGDFTHRVRSRQKDQLGSLGESFNAMIGSIGSLIEEQKQRQRLENELAIAQQVQSQLFPKELPRVSGVDLAAVCRAARVVSGDYYDFISLGPHRLAIALADISGKGISAALLMASLQAALRSQVLLDGDLSGTAELVSRVNRHLYVNTSDDRYATFFYAVYDAQTRVLHYTNAGHLPPFLVTGDRIHKLEDGGMVVGLFDNCDYQQGSITVEPGSVLVAYSDGLIEPENVYGEQFGIDRLADELLRHRAAAPQSIVDSLMAAADEWGSSPEQADDMTVVVARL